MQLKYKFLTFFALVLLPVCSLAANSPSGVNILWEAQTYTPLFYRGASLATQGSTVKVTVSPAPKNFIYTWKRNGIVDLSISGVGKSSFSFVMSDLRLTEKIEVEVSDVPSGPIKSYGVLTITAREPQVLFYQNEPLSGTVYQKALVDKIELSDAELNLVAEPYFFSQEDVVGGLIEYRWSMNDKNIATDPVNSRFLTVRVGDSTGQAQLNIFVENARRLLQIAKSNLLINFSSKTSLLPKLISKAEAATSDFGSYSLLEPIGGVSEVSTQNSFSEYLSAGFRYAILLAGFLAVLMIVIGGVAYAVSAAPGAKELAKERIESAIFGLIIVLVAWLILFTINPNLVGLGLTIPTTQPQTTPPPGPPPTTGDEQAIRNRLNHAGIGTPFPPCGTSPCTNFAGLPESAINNLIVLKNKCTAVDPQCRIIVTGGTEKVGHGSDTNHGPGNAVVDIDDNSSLNAYLQQFNPGCNTIGQPLNGPGGLYRFENSGCRGASESHWHVEW